MGEHTRLYADKSFFLAMDTAQKSTTFKDRLEPIFLW